MSLEQVDALRAHVAGRPKDVPLAQRRAGFEAMMADAPLPDGTAVETVAITASLGGEIVTTPGTDHSRLLVWLHGGQFAIGSAASYRAFAANVSAASGCAVLTPDYRLAPEHRFPAAHDDSETALGWALTNSDRVAIGGDSAGANLALAAVQACPPGPRSGLAALWLLSPYLDLSHKAGSITARAPRDPFVDPQEMDAVAVRYLGTASPTDVRASPLFGPLDALPPLLVQVGSDEALFDDAARLAAAVPHAVFQQWVGMIHVWPLFAAQIDEGHQAIAQAGAFLRRSLFET
jgi:acetyl esterase/lipase